PPISTLFPYTTLFRSSPLMTLAAVVFVVAVGGFALTTYRRFRAQQAENVRHEMARARRRTVRRPSASRVSRARAASTTDAADQRDRKSTRLNSSHSQI